jgi:hypothetical protein
MAMERHQPFQYVVNDGPTKLEIELMGALDERAKMPEVRSRDLVILNLAKLTQINSIGTRIWISWIQRFRPPARVILENCPVIMVKTFSVVRGSLPAHYQVNSFAIPFYSEETGERHDFFVLRGKHFGENQPVQVPEIKDSKGHLMEIDVIAESYLAFLKP